MDKEQEEIQFLSFIGIFKETLNIILSWRNIFSQITVAIILPLSFIFLIHIEISDFLFASITYKQNSLDFTQPGTSSYASLSNSISSEWTMFWLFKLAYFIFFLVFSLLSTAAVVYSIACIYTAKEVTFKKVMSVVPKVWERLIVTFIWNFIVVFAYNIVAISIFMLGKFYIGPSSIGLVLLTIFLIIYLIGFVYISVIWHLASVVSVLEEDYGIHAMIKSKELIKGKMDMAIAIFLPLTLCFIGIQVAFESFVVQAVGDSIWLRIGYANLCFLCLSILTLFGLIAQTVVYFVCKSYHHENIDKSSLADHLDVKFGDYVPLKSNDIQLEPFDV